ncbi:MAG: ribosome maturation factor RimP [Acidimicrobiales bacterium]
MGRSEELGEALVEALGPSGPEVVDAEVRPGIVRVLLDRPGGIDLDALAGANRAVSQLLDSRPELAPPGSYQLEVSSPGVERPLRRPDQFRRFVGETVSVKTVPGMSGDRRSQGRLVSVDDDAVVIELPPGGPGDGTGSERRIRYSEIAQARTVFEWGPASSEAGRAARGKPGRTAPGTVPPPAAARGRESR